MWKLLGTLVSGFLLLRDLFGYVLPGALFLGLAGSYLGHVFPNDWLRHLTEYETVAPFWFFAILILVLSYLAGQVLVAIGYTAAGAVEFLVQKIRHKEKPKSATLSADELYYRYLYPAIFTEVDRRGTINILRLGIAVGLIAGSCFLYPQSLSAFWLALLLGVFMTYNWRTGVRHVGNVARNSMKAAALVAQAGARPYDWGVVNSEAEAEKEPDENAKGTGAGI